MSADSIKNNTPVYGQSAYRSFEKQRILFNDAALRYGKESADLDTARPGHSEHQAGLAIDVSSTKNGNMLDFENTDSFNWMVNNAHKYGFILRYPKGKEEIHGYVYEAWHYRYVGIEVATDMYNNYSDLTYDEYY
ncbi:MAG: D-alanyl-D-alanine carboxypeptidase family protein, partial [Bacilli bacterium]